MSDFLFVYGTLRRDANHPMHQQLLERHSRFIAMAHYQGCLYQISHYPGVVPSVDASQQVIGEVYRLLTPAQTLVQLDNYEGCGVNFARPHEYCRVQQQVWLATGKPLTAWVYLYNHSIAGRAQLVTGDYLQP